MKTLEAYGRTITLTLAEPDEFGQFRVAVSVDGKERWAARFTDKTDYESEQALTDALYAFQARTGHWPSVDEQTVIRERMGIGTRP